MPHQLLGISDESRTIPFPTQLLEITSEGFAFIDRYTVPDGGPGLCSQLSQFGEELGCRPTERRIRARRRTSVGGRIFRRRFHVRRQEVGQFIEQVLP